MPADTGQRRIPWAACGADTRTGFWFLAWERNSKLETRNQNTQGEAVRAPAERSCGHALALGYRMLSCAEDYRAGHGDLAVPGRYVRVEVRRVSAKARRTGPVGRVEARLRRVTMRGRRLTGDFAESVG
jgi:hypothetical protein